MALRYSKKRHATSLREAMEFCLVHAREKRNLSVDRVADLMGLSSRWALYKWMENGRLPAILIRPFENACGSHHVTEYIAGSAGKLLIDSPSGRKVTELEINQLQAAFSDAIGHIIRFYDGKTTPDEAISSLTAVIGSLAWHEGNIRKHGQPELDFKGDDHE